MTTAVSKGTLVILGLTLTAAVAALIFLRNPSQPGREPQGAVGSSSQANSPQKLPRKPDDRPQFMGQIRELNNVASIGGIENAQAWARAALAGNPDPQSFWTSFLEYVATENQCHWVGPFILAEWAAQDARTAIAAIEGYANLPPLSRFSSPERRCGYQIFKRLPPNQRDDVWSMLASAEPSTMNQHVLDVFLDSYLREAPLSGVARFEKLSPSLQSSNMWQQCTGMLARHSPSRLPAWLNESNRPTLASDDENPALREARSQMRLLTDASSISSGLRHYYTETGDLDTILKLLPELPEKIQQSTIPRLLESGVSGPVLESFDKWNAITKDLAQSGGGDFSTEVLVAHVEAGAGTFVESLNAGALDSEKRMSVAKAFAETAPAPAFEWALSLPENEHSLQAIEQVVVYWARAEPISATKAIARLNPGMKRTQAEAQLQVAIQNRDDPEVTARVTELLRDQPE